MKKFIIWTIFLFALAPMAANGATITDTQTLTMTFPDVPFITISSSDDPPEHALSLPAHSIAEVHGNCIQDLMFSGFDSTLGSLQEVTINYDRSGWVQTWVGNHWYDFLPSKGVVEVFARHSFYTLSSSLPDVRGSKVIDTIEVYNLPKGTWFGCCAQGWSYEFIDDDGEFFSFSGIDALAFQNVSEFTIRGELAMEMGLLQMTGHAYSRQRTHYLYPLKADVTVSYTYDDGTTPVPIPTTILLLGSGLLGLVGVRIH